MPLLTIANFLYIMIKHYKVLKNLARIHIHNFNYVSLESIAIDSDKNQYKEFEKNMVK